MTHLLIQPGSLARPQSAATAAIGLFVRHLDKTKERMLRSRYLGAGRLATVDKYYYLSDHKTIIIIIFPTRPTAWSPLSVHQAKTPSSVPFYNSCKWSNHRIPTFMWYFGGSGIRRALLLSRQLKSPREQLCTDPPTDSQNDVVLYVLDALVGGPRV